MHSTRHGVTITPMFIKSTSIRGKITTGFVISFLFLFLVASALFAALLVIEERIEFYSVISRFLDTTLEMRRYEKNFFLYGKPEDMNAALSYADAAGKLIAGSAAMHPPASSLSGWLMVFTDGDTIAELRDASPEKTLALINKYCGLYRKGGEVERGPEIESSIREAGREITSIAERLASAESRNIHTMLISTRRSIIVMVALFFLGTALIARVVLRVALRPLKELETGMKKIAAGDYEMLPVTSRNDAIDSMNSAFNRMIREIFEQRQEMMQSEKLASLGTMLAGIAHEVNNPLSNISTSAEILEDELEGGEPEYRKELVGQIISETDRATDIIRTVLEFTRERRFQKMETNLLSAVKGALVLARGEMPSHVSVSIDVPPGITLEADRQKLFQAFINLIKNSIDAMRPGIGESRITITGREAGPDIVEIVFSDTGEGISEHLLDKVFDPFFSTKDVGKGTGLGLYLTHQIVEQHSGTIKVESGSGTGTKVTIRLPKHARQL